MRGLTTSLLALFVILAWGESQCAENTTSNLRNALDRRLEACFRGTSPINANIAMTSLISVPAETGKSVSAMMSPDSSTLIIQIHLPNPRSGILKIIDLKSKRLVKEISLIKSKDVEIYPSDIRWSPQSKSFYVRMRYSDIGYGEWCCFDVSKLEYTEDAKKKIKKLLSTEKADRDKIMLGKAKFWPKPPVWSQTGVFYEDDFAAMNAGVQDFWQEPSHLGDTNFKFLLDSDQLCEVLLERGSRVKDEDDKYYTRGHVFSNGLYIRTLHLAAHFIPNGVLCLYENESLSLYGNLGNSKNAWRVDLGNRELLSAHTLDDDGVIIMTKDDNEINCSILNLPDIRGLIQNVEQAKPESEAGSKMQNSDRQ